MGLTEKSSTGGFVNSTRLDTNKPILYDINSSNSVLSGNLVTVEEKFKRISDLGLVLHVGDLGWDSVLKFNTDSFGSFRSSLGRCCHLEHGLIRSTHGIFELATLVRCVVHVFIDGIVGLGFGINRDSMLCAVSQEILTSLETLNELRITPRGNGTDLGGEGLSTHLKTNLIISFSSGSVRDKLCTLCFGDANHLLGDARTGDGSSKQIT
mmetsp:Transcript_1591/g.1510  ORF Transcript_1591/g.1510 Transcript_1591/m.1510 type:complete len:210 (+) Transcript_1591:403-1032(+)